MKPFDTLESVLQSLSLSDIEDKNLIRTIDEDNQLTNFIHRQSSSELILTFAEQVLLIEGSQLGKADCTIPPYVEYENLLLSSSESGYIPNADYIRSEVMEWALSTGVSKILFKSGILTVSGAFFLTSGDYNARGVIDKMNFAQSNDRFSLDLSSRDIYIDLKFNDCIFYSGINFSNSYCESFYFSKCSFGSSRFLSIKGNNTVLKGDLVIEEHKGFIRGSYEDDLIIINNNVDLSYAQIEGQLKIVGDNSKVSYNPKTIIINGWLNLQDVQANTIVLNYIVGIPKGVYFNNATVSSSIYCINAFIQGEISAINLKAKEVYFDKSLFLSDFTGRHLKCEILSFGNGFAIYGIVNLLYAEINILSGESSYFFGFPTSIYAAGIESKAIFLRDRCWVANGALFYKSKITGDFDCSGGLFGYSQEDAHKGICVSVRSSIIRNISFSDGFTSYGKIDLGQATVEDSLTFRSSKIVALESDQRQIAIYGSHISVKNKLSFNVDRTNTPKIQSSYPTVMYYEFMEMRRQFIILKLNLTEDLKLENNNLNIIISHINNKINKYKEPTNRQSKEYEEWSKICDMQLKDIISMFVIDKTEILDFTKRYIANTENNKIFENFNIKLKNLKDKIEKENILEIINRRLNDMYLEAKVENISKLYACVNGESNFENAIVDGKVDLAGALFINNNKSDSENLCNAIDLRFANIKGSLFANNGYKEFDIPFIAKGDVDLQNADINSIFISAFRNYNFTNWRMIGTKYNYISDDSNDPINHKNFYTGSWIFTNKNDNNFRQPYEQFSNVLLQSGEDVQARDVLIKYRPPRNWRESFIMLPIKGVYWLSRSIQRSIFWLFIFWVIGGGVFFFGKMNGLIVQNVSDDTKKVNQNFNALIFSLQKLIPLSGGDLEKNVTATYSTESVSEILFLMYYLFHSVIGLILISMLIISIARIRKGSN